MENNITSYGMKPYDPNYPSNSTLIKDIPNAIRTKGEQLLGTIDNIEKARTNVNVSSAIAEFPHLKTVFVDGSTDIPSGMYIKQLNTWIGYDNYDRMPGSIDLLEVNQRVTIDDKTFEIIDDNGTRLMAEKNSFLPEVVFDFHELGPNTTNINLKNRGLFSQSIILLNVQNADRYQNLFYPYLATKQGTILTTKVTDSNPYNLSNRFTISATFKKISRTYQDGSNIMLDTSKFSSLLRVFDDVGTYNVALIYDANNNLFLDLNGVVVNLEYLISEDMYYQFSIKVLNDNIYILANGQEIYKNTTLDFSLDSKNAFFSFATAYAQSSIAVGALTGAVVLTDPAVFREAITIEENICLKDRPRNYSLKEPKLNYLSLTIEEQKFIKDWVMAQMALV